MPLTLIVHVLLKITPDMDAGGDCSTQVERKAPTSGCSFYFPHAISDFEPDITEKKEP